MAPRGQLPGPSSGIPDRRDSKRNGGFNQQKLLEGRHEWAVARLLAQEGAKQSPLELPVTPEETEKNKWTLKDSPSLFQHPSPLSLCSLGWIVSHRDSESKCLHECPYRAHLDHCGLTKPHRVTRQAWWHRPLILALQTGSL